MFKLGNWSFMKDSEGFIGSGYCYGNPKFTEGLLIMTSPVVRTEIDDEKKRLKLFTFSGSCYVLDFADIDEMNLERTKEVLKNTDFTIDLEECLVLKKQMEEDYKKKLADRLKPNELYVVMSGGQSIIKAHFKTEQGDVVKINVGVHVGMFQDSIIVADHLNGWCDWRIFPSEMTMTPYHWSDNIETVHIENVGNDFEVNFGDQRRLCKSGEITDIKKEEFTREALVSPDAFNGKNKFCEDFSDD